MRNASDTALALMEFRVQNSLSPLRIFTLKGWDGVQPWESEHRLKNSEQPHRLLLINCTSAVIVGLRQTFLYLH